MKAPLLYPSRPLRVYSSGRILNKDPTTWKLQYKFGGHHLLVSTHRDPYMNSRHGTPLASAAKTDFSNLCATKFGRDSIFDGELMLPLKKTREPPWFVIWDAPVFRGRDLSREPYSTRLAILAKFWTDFRELGRIRVAHNLWIAELKDLNSLAAMLERCDGKLLEGVVVKDTAHPLDWSRVAQINSTGQLKLRVAS